MRGLKKHDMSYVTKSNEHSGELVKSLIYAHLAHMVPVVQQFYIP